MNRPVRLLFTIDSLGFGGAERQLVELVKGLIHEEGYEIHIVCLLKTDEGYMGLVSSLGLHIHYIERSFKYDLLGLVIAVTRYIRTHRIDLVHTFMTLGSLVGCLAAKLTSRPVVCSAIRDGKDQSLRAKYSKQFLAKIADRFVANSRAGFANRFKKIRPHFRVVYNGIDLPRFSEKAESGQILREDLKLIDKGPVIGMVGSLSRNKDQGTLLRAAPRVLASFPDAIFLLVGDGERRSSLEALATEIGIRQNVIFTGFRRDVDQLYSLMDVCVLLTNNRIHLEGISNALTEAMAMSLPVIASAGGGTDELIQHEENGLIVEPHNPEKTAAALLHLLLIPAEERQRLAASSRQRVQKLFGLNRYVQEYKTLYIECLTNK